MSYQYRLRTFFFVTFVLALLICARLDLARQAKILYAQGTSNASSSVGVTVEVPASISPSPPPPPNTGGGEGSVVLPLKGPATLVFQGFSYPDALIYLLKNGSVVGTAQALSDGKFEKVIATESGTAQYSVWGRDRRGARSSTVTYSLTLLPKATTTVQNVYLSPTLRLGSPKIPVPDL